MEIDVKYLSKEQTTVQYWIGIFPTHKYTHIHMYIYVCVHKYRCIIVCMHYMYICIITSLSTHLVRVQYVVRITYFNLNSETVATHSMCHASFQSTYIRTYMYTCNYVYVYLFICLLSGFLYGMTDEYITGYPWLRNATLYTCTYINDLWPTWPRPPCRVHNHFLKCTDVVHCYKWLWVFLW